MAKSQCYGDVEAGNGVGDAKRTDKHDAGFVAITDGPADEVWVRLAAEGSFGDLYSGTKGGWMCGVLQGVKNKYSVTVR